MTLWSPPEWHAIEAVGTWVAAVGTVGAVFVALNLARRDTKSRRIERRGDIVAMSADVFQGRLRMTALVREAIQAPLYRIPETMLQHGLPRLIGDGRLTQNEIDVLLEYASRVAEINRGLDRAGDAHASQPSGSDHLTNEFARNQAKANEVLYEESGRFGNESLIDAAERALFRVGLAYSPWWVRVAARWKGKSSAENGAPMNVDNRRWIYRTWVPTRHLYERIKARRLRESPEKAAAFARRWPSYLLAIELVVAALLSVGTLSRVGLDHYLLVRWVAYVASIFAISRVAEIVGAYYYDAMDSFADDRGPASLSKPDRVKLVMKSYPSLVINWAVIYFALPSTQFLAHAPDGTHSYALQSFIDAIYFSGVTIATVGYGDIAPTGPWSRLLSICEVGMGILVLVFALGAYLAAPTDPSAKKEV